MAKSYNELDYANAVARVRALQGKLIDNATIEKMLFAPSVGEAIRALADCGYNTELPTVEAVIDAEQRRVMTLLVELGARNLVDMLRTRYDYHNAKVLQKAQLTGIPPDDMLIPLGHIDPDFLRARILDREYRGLSPTMGKALTDALETYGRMPDISMIDCILDAAMFREYARMDIEDEKVREIFRVQMDIHNIKTARRLAALDKGAAAYHLALVDWGYIPISAYTEGSVQFMYTRYSDVVGGDNMEAQLDNYFLDVLRKTHLTPFGLSPIVGYYFEKENELLNVRIVLLCKRAGIKIEDIRQRLRAVSM